MQFEKKCFQLYILVKILKYLLPKFATQWRRHFLPHEVLMYILDQHH